MEFKLKKFENVGGGRVGIRGPCMVRVWDLAGVLYVTLRRDKLIDTTENNTSLAGDKNLIMI